MDVLAHALWAAALAKGINFKLKKISYPGRLRVGWSTFWGIFPDLFAFSIPFSWLLWQRLFSDTHLPFITPGIEPPADGVWILELAKSLYNISHSAIIFAAVFLAVWAIRRRPQWELLGWLLHIAVDIPTHTANFFPTPVFWPISKVYFTHGVFWAEPWFMAINYSLLLLAYGVLFLKKRNALKAIVG